MAFKQADVYKEAIKILVRELAPDPDKACTYCEYASMGERCPGKCDRAIHVAQVAIGNAAIKKAAARLKYRGKFIEKEVTDDAEK